MGVKGRGKRDRVGRSHLSEEAAGKCSERVGAAGRARACCQGACESRSRSQHANPARARRQSWCKPRRTSSSGSFLARLCSGLRWTGLDRAWHSRQTRRTPSLTRSRTRSRPTPTSASGRDTSSTSGRPCPATTPTWSHSSPPGRASPPRSASRPPSNSRTASIATGERPHKSEPAASPWRRERQVEHYKKCLLASLGCPCSQDAMLTACPRRHRPVAAESLPTKRLRSGQSCSSFSMIRTARCARRDLGRKGTLVDIVCTFSLPRMSLSPSPKSPDSTTVPTGALFPA